MSISRRIVGQNHKLQLRQILSSLNAANEQKWTQNFQELIVNHAHTFISAVSQVNSPISLSFFTVCWKFAWLFREKFLTNYAILRRSHFIKLNYYTNFSLFLSLSLCVYCISPSHSECKTSLNCVYTIHSVRCVAFSRAPTKHNFLKWH